MNAPPLSAEPAARRARARLSLEGLSVGDAFGEQFFILKNTLLIQFRELPDGAPWPWTDDTAMAIGLCANLGEHAQVEPDALARRFAADYTRDPRRGYGASIQRLLRQIAAGGDWRTLATSSFGGEGSMGNGSAMRVAPLGAWFADAEPVHVVEQAVASARVTHAHPEACAAAAAVALAAHFACHAAACRAAPAQTGLAMLAHVIEHMPDSQTRDRIRRVAGELWNATLDTLIVTVGNGITLLAQDTVPLCLWVAAHNIGSYENALWSMVSASGDTDTNCAIVGGIVALAVGDKGIPPEWVARREAFQL